MTRVDMAQNVGDIQNSFFVCSILDSEFVFMFSSLKVLIKDVGLKMSGKKELTTIISAICKLNLKLK